MSLISNVFHKFLRNWKAWCACAVIFFLLNTIYIVSQVNRSSKPSKGARNNHAADAISRSAVSTNDQDVVVRSADSTNYKATRKEETTRSPDRTAMRDNEVRSADFTRNRIAIMLRGADPSHIIQKLVKYEIGAEATFNCLDGSKTVLLDSVNDDFCDCQDGSDEPGTNACNNGRFYCSVEHKFIHSTYVNDGICDCCNGEDEWMKLQPLYILPQKYPSKKFVPCTNVCGT